MGMVVVAKTVIRGIIDNIDHGNICHFIYRNMVIGNGMGFPHLEKMTVPQMMAVPPDLIDDTGRILYGNSFFVKPGAFCTYHIQKNSIISGITCLMGGSGPVLGSQAPPVGIIVSGLGALRSAVIFAVK